MYNIFLSVVLQRCFSENCDYKLGHEIVISDLTRDCRVKGFQHRRLDGTFIQFISFIQFLQMAIVNITKINTGILCEDRDAVYD